MSATLYAIDPGKRGPALAVFRQDLVVERVRAFRWVGEKGLGPSEVAHRIAKEIAAAAFRDATGVPNVTLAIEGPKLSPFSGTYQKAGKTVRRTTNLMTVDHMARIRQALFEEFFGRSDGCLVYVEPTPTEVKKATGSGRAKKIEVVEWARSRFPTAMSSSDVDGVKWKEEAVADALATGVAGARLLAWER